jgi:hypothetical protein
MKVFWSWQSDSPGNIGRHFVRDTLEAAIKVLKEPSAVEEPSERDARESLHLDHDRKGISGSPDLAPTIFKKIDQASVFVADVTLVGETTIGTGQSAENRTKKLINSNVAIEYGYALHSIGDAAILMIQNRHFGERDDLPFDLKHKAGPIQYSLAPSASGAEIEAERAGLKGNLVTALRPFLASARPAAAQVVAFPETPTTFAPAYFFDRSDVIAWTDEIEYRFHELHAFYLRLIPTKPRALALKFTELDDLVRRRKVDVLSRTLNAGLPSSNRFGAVAFESHGISTTPSSFTQAFPNGELWGVTRNLLLDHQGTPIIPTGNVKNLYERVLGNYCMVARDDFGIEPPYQIELGAVGISNMRLGVEVDRISDVIHRDQHKLRRMLNDASHALQRKLVGDFLDELFDLARERRPNTPF